MSTRSSPQRRASLLVRCTSGPVCDMASLSCTAFMIASVLRRLDVKLRPPAACAASAAAAGSIASACAWPTAAPAPDVPPLPAAAAAAAAPFAAPPLCVAPARLPDASGDSDACAMRSRSVSACPPSFRCSSTEIMDTTPKIGACSCEKSSGASSAK